MADPDDSLVPLSTAAEITGRSVRTVRRWTKEGRVVHVRDDRGRLLVDKTSLPGFGDGPEVTVAAAAEVTEKSTSDLADRDTFEVETVTTDPNPHAQVLSVAVRLLNQAYAHTEKVFGIATGDIAAQKTDLYKEMARVRAENARLHHEMREMRQVEQDALDKTVEREMKIEDWSRENEREDRHREIIETAVANWLGKRFDGSKIGDVVSSVSESLKDHAKKPNGATTPQGQGDQRADRPDAPASEED